MTRARLCLCVFLAAVICRPAAAQEAQTPEDLKVWLVPPSVDARPTKNDVAARKELVELFDQRQEAEFRRLYHIDLPKGGSGLAANYTLRLHGNYVASAASASLFEIQVADGKATAQYVRHSGIYAGELPFEEVDRLARQLVYGFAAVVVDRDPDPDRLDNRRAWFASHVPYVTIEVQSPDKKVPLHLRTEPWQLIRHSRIEQSDDVRRFVHARVCLALTGLAYHELPALAVKEQNDLVLAKLRRLPADDAAEPWSYQRMDLRFVEAVLYSHLALERALPAALPELERIRKEPEATLLKMVLAEDGNEQLAKLIAAPEDKLNYEALKLTEKKPRFTPALVAALAKTVEQSDRDRILDKLRDLPLAKADVAAVDRMYMAAENKEKIDLAGLLLNQSHAERYFDDLKAIAENKANAYSRHLAADVLIRYAAASGKHREEGYQLLLDRLDSATDREKARSITQLAKLGSKKDLPLLEKFADLPGESYLADQAIETIMLIDPRRAAERVRKQLHSYVTEPTDARVYASTVAWHYDFLFWQNDREVVEDLKRARRLLNDEGLDEHDPQSLIDYLEAREPAQRLAAARVFIRRHHIRPAWIAAVGRELLAAGADAQECQALIAKAEKSATAALADFGDR